MKTVDLSLDGLSVMVGIPAGRDLPALTVRSLIGTLTRCQAMGIPCQLGMVTGSAVVQWARDEVVDLFLQSGANRLFWIDSDMTWEPNQFIRLLALSQVRDVVCGSYPAKMDRPTFFVRWDENSELTQDDLGLMEIHGVGLGFTVMRREVVETLANKAPRITDDISGKEMAEIFRVGAVNGRRKGEDMAFFDDIRAAGYRVHLDPSIDLGHIGTKHYTGSIRDALRPA